MSFYSYVLKKYILLLGAVIAIAALICGMSIKRSYFVKSPAKHFYTVFAVKAPLSLSKQDGLALNWFFDGL